jgi:hypothetical protein
MVYKQPCTLPLIGGVVVSHDLPLSVYDLSPTKSFAVRSYTYLRRSDVEVVTLSQSRPTGRKVYVDVYHVEREQSESDDVVIWFVKQDVPDPADGIYRVDLLADPGRQCQCDGHRQQLTCRHVEIGRDLIARDLLADPVGSARTEVMS